MENPCLGCPRNCCKNFKIAGECTNPQGLKEKLSRFPFIHKIDQQLIIGPGGKEVIVGIYHCDRFDEFSETCIEHETKERPDFCHKTGESGMFFPHDGCLLKDGHLLRSKEF